MISNQNAKRGFSFPSFPFTDVLVSDLQMLSMEMSRSCSYMDGWSFLPDRRLKVDWECSLVTFIRISPVP